MGMHTLDELLRQWRQENLTAEQMIGQLLQHMGVLYERLRLLERRVGSFEAQNAERIMPNDTKQINP